MVWRADGSWNNFRKSLPSFCSTKSDTNFRERQAAIHFLQRIYVITRSLLSSMPYNSKVSFDMLLHKSLQARSQDNS